MADAYSPTANLNIPGVCGSFSAISSIVSGTDNIAIIGNNCNNSIKIRNCTIYYNEDSFPLTANFLESSLIDKRVFIPLYGASSWLNTNNPTEWVITDGDIPDNTVDYKNTGVFDDRGIAYAEVLIQGETCVAELICNAYAYTYDISSNTFRHTTNKHWNLIKPVVRKFLPIITGGNEDRVADYGKLLLFVIASLHDKDSLPDNIKALLQFAPSEEELTNIVRRELLTQQFVAEAKKNPQAFLEWKENWGKFWWETNE